MAEEFTVPWFATPLQTADAALLVVDLSDPACTDQLSYVLDWLDRAQDQAGAGLAGHSRVPVGR